MPRVTIGDRLKILAESPYLSENKRKFADSLLVYYQKRGSLTKGRREWLNNLEQMEQEAKGRNHDHTPAIIDEIENVLSRVEDSTWNRGFLESIRDQALYRGGTLSARQLEIFEKIKHEYSEESIAGRADWAAEYRGNHIDNARVVANYYNTTPYYTEVARNILNDDNYVPSVSLFNKMVGNKYAQKVLAAWNSAPKYPVGTSIVARPNGPHSRALKNGGVVLSNREPIISAAKGAKRYKVLPYDSAKPIMVEERYVKLFRNKK